MANSAQWTVANGAYVTTSVVPGGFTAQLYNPAGAPVGPAFSAIQSSLGDYTARTVVPLADGGYVIGYEYDGALLPGFLFDSATFTSGGQLLAQSSVSAAANGFPSSPVSLSALPDGGFVAEWTAAAAYSSGPNEVVIREFNAQGSPVESPLSLGTASGGAPDAVPSDRGLSTGDPWALNSRITTSLGPDE